MQFEPWTIEDGGELGLPIGSYDTIDEARERIKVHAADTKRKPDSHDYYLLVVGW